MPFFVRFIIFLSSPHPTFTQLIFVRFADDHGNYFPSSMETIRLQIGITNFRSLNRSSRNCNEADSLRLKPLFPAQTLFSKRFSHHSLTHLRHFHSLAKATDPHHHHHDHHHGHNHHHQYDHGGHAKLSRAQEAFLCFTEMIRWTDLADFLREHLELCCYATALFIVATACTYLLPKPAVKPLQRVFILIVFPLVRIEEEERKLESAIEETEKQCAQVTAELKELELKSSRFNELEERYWHEFNNFQFQLISHQIFSE